MPTAQGAVNSHSGGSGAILESIKRSVMPQAGLMAYQISPFLSTLMSKPMIPMTSTKIEVHDYELRRRTWTTATGGQDATSDSTITLSSTTQAAEVRVRDILRVRGTQEKLLVTAVSSNNLTVTRGYGGTTKATIPSGATLEHAGNAALEGADWADTGGHTPNVSFNYSHIIKHGYKVSGTMSALETVSSLNGMTNQLDIEGEMALRTAVEDLARAVLNSVAPGSTTQGSGTVARTMNGLIEIIREGDAANEGAIYSDISSADFNSTDAIDNLDSLLKQLYDIGARTNTIAVNSRVKAQLSKRLHGNNGERDANLRSVTQNVVEYESSFGVYRIMLESKMPEDGILIFNPDDINLAVLRPFEDEPIAKGGDHTRRQIVGEFSLYARSGRTGQALYGYGAAS